MKRTWILTAAIAFLSGQYGYAGQVPGLHPILIYR